MVSSKTLQNVLSISLLLWAYTIHLKLTLLFKYHKGEATVITIRLNEPNHTDYGSEIFKRGDLYRNHQGKL